MKTYVMYSHAVGSSIDQIEVATTNSTSAFDTARIVDVNNKSYYLDIWENDVPIQLYEWIDMAWKIKWTIDEPQETE